MKTKMTPRLERALRVLYTAFHEGTLDAMDCKHCAVGNMVGHDNWTGDGFFGCYDRVNSDYVGYSAFELAQVEHLFLYGTLGPKTEPKFENTISKGDVICGWRNIEEQKELQFNGLCAVVEYLCGLDGVENVMELQGLFEMDDKGNAKVGIESLVG